MEITRRQAVQVFDGLGISGSETWTKREMLQKLGSLCDTVSPTDIIGDPQLDNLLDDLIAASRDKEEIQFVKEDKDPLVPKGAIKKNRKEKVAKQIVSGEINLQQMQRELAQEAFDAKRLSKPKKPKRVRSTLGRPYLAGWALSVYGLEAGITDELVEIVEERSRKENPAATMYMLKTAWHVINGYLNGAEYVE